jgi:hypothetical protein
MNINYTKTCEEIFEEIENVGYGTIENAISKNDLEKCKNNVQNLINENKGSFSLVGNENLQNTLLNNLYHDQSFLSLQDNLVRKKIGLNHQYYNQDKYQVLRVLNGVSLNSQSHLFHFDNFTLTVLLPIYIPENKGIRKNGDLLVLPNVRELSFSPNKNALVKILTQNPLTRNLLKFAFIRKLFKFKHMKLQPGNLYFFWGFTTYHGNDDCDLGEIRSTALFHYHKTITKSSLLSVFTATKKRSRIKPKA